MTETPQPAALAVLEQYIAFPCPRFEGDVDHFYLDVKGNVTIATGCLVPNAAAAILLPMRDRSTGEPVNAAAIATEFAEIQTKPFGTRYPASWYAHPLRLMMAPADRLALRRQRATECLTDLRRLFPAFDQFPAAAQLALLDMRFNLGPNRLRDEYVHFIVAVRARDWRGAAGQSGRDKSDPAFADRNRWTAAQFLEAAKGAKP